LLNVVAAHVEGLMYPPICLFDTLFRVNIPLMCGPHVCSSEPLMTAQVV
jgi:hypothetical protein